MQGGGCQALAAAVVQVQMGDLGYGPQGEAHGGGAVAAPVFSAITQGALRLLDVTPSEFPATVAAHDPGRGGSA